MRAKTTPINTEGGNEPRNFAIAGHVLPARRMEAGLYLVATPIGNLADVTLRALETLAGADVIACEDTRITRRLTERYAIAAELTPYHEHNAAVVRPHIMKRLAEGAALALISDAGTPLVSDPGYKLVGEALAAGFHVDQRAGVVVGTGQPHELRIEGEEVDRHRAAVPHA